MNAQQLITDHIDLWTSTLSHKATQGRGSSNKIDLHGIQKLRELILELAVRGKLVPQNPTDEPAEQLLERIAAEKDQLIKDKKIKKPKELPKISDEEKPFDLPRGWNWARFQDITSYIQRGKGPKYADNGSVKVISQKCIQWSGFDLTPARYIEDSSLEKYQEERFLKTHDLLWNSTGTGTVGRINEVLDVTEKTLVADSHVTVIRPLGVLGRFLTSYVAAPGVQARIEPNHENALVSGSTKQVELNTSSVITLVLPVPPLPEQHRIVTKVDELMALCDQLESQTRASIEAHQTLATTLLDSLVNVTDAAELASNWGRVMDNFDLLFTANPQGELALDHLKQTILQLAVMGKLVKQDPNDEPASQLLERISAEKFQLIKDKKIKKQKPLPEISEDEKPFELPEGWESCRLMDLVPQFQNGASSRGDKEGRDTIVLRLADINNWRVSLKDTRSICIEEKSINRYSLKEGDVLIIRVNGSADIVGRFITCTDNYDAIYCDHFIRMRFPIKCFSPGYLSLLGSSKLIREKIADLFVSTAGQKTVNQGHINSLVVTVPPLAEQDRIVAKVDQLTVLCDQLKARLQAAQQTQFQLTDTVVEGALA